MSSYQKVFQQQKYESAFVTIKTALNKNLRLIPGDQSKHINEELLEVITNDYNSDLRIRQEQKKIENLHNY